MPDTLTAELDTPADAESVTEPESIDETDEDDDIDGEVFETPFTAQPAGKVCTCCGDYLPLSKFWKHAKAPDGLHYWCVSCFPKVVGEAKRLREELLNQGYKTCGCCDKTKRISTFGRHARNPDGLRSICRDCESKQSSARRTTSPDQH